MLAQHFVHLARASELVSTRQTPEDPSILTTTYCYLFRAVGGGVADAAIVLKRADTAGGDSSIGLPLPLSTVPTKFAQFYNKRTYARKYINHGMSRAVGGLVVREISVYCEGVSE